MSYTKRQFIEEAFDGLGLATYAFELSADQWERALRKLDAMMAEWNALGIRLGYPLPTSPENSDLDSETNVTDSANSAIINNLSVRLGPAYGKAVSIEIKVAAKQGYDALLSKTLIPSEMQYSFPTLAGSGNKYWRNTSPTLQPPTDPLSTGLDGNIDL